MIERDLFLPAPVCYVPVPLSATVCGLPPPLSFTFSGAALGPLFIGVNVTLMLQLPPAGTLVPRCWTERSFVPAFRR